MSSAVYIGPQQDCHLRIGTGAVKSEDSYYSSEFSVVSSRLSSFGWSANNTERHPDSPVQQERVQCVDPQELKQAKQH